jgi:hypothetical protein
MTRMNQRDCGDEHGITLSLMMSCFSEVPMEL